MLGEAAQRLGETVRFESALSPQLRELAILVVAAKWKAQYEWWAHEKIARREGLDEKHNRKRQGGRHSQSSPTQPRQWSITLPVNCSTNIACQTSYTARQSELLGEAEVVELAILLGYYTLVSMTLNVFEVPVPAGEDAPFIELETGKDQRVP